MPDALTELAANLGDKPALIDDRPDGTVLQWSFAELEANANRLARVFMAHGVEPGDKVLWCGQNSMWPLACGHAARKAGAISVPLNYRLTDEEATYVTHNSDAKIVFTDAQFAPLFERIRPNTPQVAQVMVFDGAPGSGQLDAAALLAGMASGPVELGVDPAKSGTMIYTSGTTGNPKGAVRTGAGDPDQGARMVETYRWRPDDVYLTTGPLYHSGPSGFLAVGQMLGNTAIVQRVFDAEDWLRLLDKYAVTATFAAPTPVRRICQLPEDVLAKYDRSSLRIMVANAAPWSYALKLQYLEHFPERSLFEVYGSTELGVNTILTPEFQRSKPGSCGQPAPGVEIRLYAEDGSVVSEPRQPGELFVRSAAMFNTYYKARDKFLADRRDGWQTVGDIAYFDEDGFYYICDRKKDMIISGGVNIYPAEIEHALELHGDVQEAAVFGIPSEEWGESVHAVVVPRPGAGLDDEGVTAYAREHLAGYKVPRSVSFVDEIPKTGSGKILKRELRAPFWEDHESSLL
ncbi:MAG: AMP-binding protein [Gammaproteobacteria bacterium]|nr:AMP-binding protein [Gammaproteobacteria bacterium]